MKLFIKKITFIVGFIHLVSFTYADENKVYVDVVAKIVKLPKTFIFPGCRCEDESIMPSESHESIIEIIIPKELAGSKLSLFHLPALQEETIWHELNSLITFTIEQSSLGSLYPQTNPKYSHKIAYAHDIKGEVVIAE